MRTFSKMGRQLELHTQMLGVAWGCVFPIKLMLCGGVSYVVYQVQCVGCQVRYVMIMCQMSCMECHVWTVMYGLSYVVWHLRGVA